MPHWQWILIQLTRRLWIRATLIGALGILAAILAAVAEMYVPWPLPGAIAADAVGDILNIIASSMLAVTTFSLSVMTSAYSSATSNVTPRATRLLIEDELTQNVLSTFLGSFLFSVVGIIALKAGAYGENGRIILFLVTIGVVMLIVASLVRWIDYLTRLGRVGETTNRVERAVRDAIEYRLANPFLGGTALRDPDNDVPESASPVKADAIAYVQLVDMAALGRCSRHYDADIYVAKVPGAFVYHDTTIASVVPASDDTDVEGLHTAVRKAFTLGGERNFDQDPRFGLAVMSEIGSRALSPGINDAGTAIDVIGRTTRLMSMWAPSDPDDAEADGKDAADDEKDVRYPRVFVPPLATDDLFDDAFLPLSRDGAGLVEVQLRIQKSLLALSHMGDDDFRKAARNQARMALERAEKALSLDSDIGRVRAIAPVGDD